MTNRQTAAKLVADGLKALKDTIKATPCSGVAKVAGKHHTSQAAAEKVRVAANKFIDPWIDRMVKLYAPKPKKAKPSDEVEEATGDQEPAEATS